MAVSLSLPPPPPRPLPPPPPADGWAGARNARPSTTRAHAPARSLPSRRRGASEGDDDDEPSPHGRRGGGFPYPPAPAARSRSRRHRPAHPRCPAFPPACQRPRGRGAAVLPVPSVRRAGVSSGASSPPSAGRKEASPGVARIGVSSALITLQERRREGFARPLPAPARGAPLSTAVG